MVTKICCSHVSHIPIIVFCAFASHISQEDAKYFKKIPSVLLKRPTFFTINAFEFSILFITFFTKFQQHYICRIN